MKKGFQLRSGKQSVLYRCLTAIFFILKLTGCGYVISSATSDLSDNLSQSILNSTDPDTIAEAIPAYLLLLDGLIRSHPENSDLLASTAKLYSSYAGTLEKQPQRAKRLTATALNYAFESACQERDSYCGLASYDYKQFANLVDSTEPDDVPVLFLLGSTWASWIQAHKDDWNAVAKLPFTVRLMERVIELDENYQNGAAHLYMGVASSLIPAAMGGKPEQGKQHFERALLLSEHKNLMAKVLFAKHYARLAFDRELHDRLLNEVLAADPVQPDLTLINTLAQRQAQALLQSAERYF